MSEAVTVTSLTMMTSTLSEKSRARDRQTDRQTDRQAGRHARTHTHTHTHTHARTQARTHTNTVSFLKFAKSSEFAAQKYTFSTPLLGFLFFLVPPQDG